MAPTDSMVFAVLGDAGARFAINEAKQQRAFSGAHAAMQY
jgi:hypothetical protein